MILLEESKNSYTFQCECRHIFKHPRYGNKLVKCTRCGNNGEISFKHGMMDIKVKKVNLKWVDLTEKATQKLLCG